MKQCARCDSKGFVFWVEGKDPRFTVIWFRNGEFMDIDHGQTADMLAEITRGCGYCEASK